MGHVGEDSFLSYKYAIFNYIVDIHVSSLLYSKIPSVMFMCVVFNPILFIEFVSTWILHTLICRWFYALCIYGL